MGGSRVRVEKVCKGVRVTSGAYDFIVYDYPDLSGTFYAASVLAKTLGGVLPSQEWLKVVYDNLGFINPLLEHKLNHHNYYWSSDEAKHGGEDAWFMNMANGRVLDFNIYDLPISVRVFSAV